MHTSSNAFLHYLRDEIEASGGHISFARFMDLALYHANFGYYNQKSFHIGEEGDFITAPELSPLFAKCFARQCTSLFDQMGHGNILEIGAGTGQFAYDLMKELQRLQSQPAYYFIYEKSLALRKKQQTFIKAALPDAYSKFVWLDTLPHDFEGIVIANEVLDALPVHRFRIADNKPEERIVTWHKDQLVFESHPQTPPPLLEKLWQLQERYELANDYESEINLSLPDFIKPLAHSIKQGVILFADYGYGQKEYYHPERKQGTLTCFYQHRKHNDPFYLPGQQDITAHVDFTHLIETASLYDCELAGFTSQATFLLEMGILDLAKEEEKHAPIKEVFRMHQAIKLLTMPSEMGEIIKIMALTKNTDVAVAGFKLQDRRRDL